MEQWKDVKGYEGKYVINSSGTVRSLERMTTYKDGRKKKIESKELKPQKTAKGYRVVRLYTENGKWKSIPVHRLVAVHFLQGSEKTMVNHKDGDKTNNHVDNLEWCTNQENIIHAYENKLFNNAKGERINTNILTPYQVRCIRNWHENNPKFFTCVMLAKAFGVSSSTISHICNRRNWRHIV